MKLLIVGSNQRWSIEKHYVKYLLEFGCDVRVFPAQGIFHEYYSKSLFNKILFKTGVSPIFRQINGQLKKEVERVRPDAVWVFKGMELYPETLEWIKARGIKLVNYNPDNPFIFSGKGSGNTNITRSLGLYDLHFTYNLSTQSKLAKELNVVTSFLPFGFDVDDRTYQLCLQEPEMQLVCFLGNPDAVRAEFILSLAGRGVRVAVYGHNWSKYARHFNIEIFPAVFEQELWKVLRKYRVQLNLMRMHNDDSHNMRTFEVPAIGGIMVAPDTQEHRNFFVNEKEVFLFSDVEQCASLIDTILRMTIQETDRIRIAARMRSLNSGYSYRHRAQHALAEIEGLLK